MSIKVMSYIWEHSKLKGSELLTLLAIADHADDEGVAYPSILKIAKKTRMTERNVQLVLKKLVRSHELVIIKNAGPHGCHLFQIQPIGVKSFQGEKFSPIKNGKDEDSIKKSVTIEKMEDENFSGGVKSFQGEKSDKKTHQISPESSFKPSEDLKPKNSLTTFESPPPPPMDRTAEKEAVLNEDYPPGFLQFWFAYPPTRRKGKKPCFKLWTMLGLEKRAQEMVAKIEALKTSSDWQRGYGPGIEVWLRNNTEDEIYCAPVITVRDHLSDREYKNLEHLNRFLQEDTDDPRREISLRPHIATPRDYLQN
jgi:hypothetical protein